MSDNSLANATNPQTNLTVRASAGTGKTWLLTSRLIRLLLSDVAPASILAITFTRKAAAEMQQRVKERLLQMASCEPKSLDHHLNEIGASINNETRQRARSLYEELLRSEHPLRTTTFHAFCQEILRRFPLEAGISPDFDLAEQTAELASAAWQRLRSQLLRDPKNSLAEAADELLVLCEGLYNFQGALNSFINYRSDWWAYTEGHADPVADSIILLEQKLGLKLTDNPEGKIWENGVFQQQLSRYAVLAGGHSAKTQQQQAQQIVSTLHETSDAHASYLKIIQVFFTQKNEPRILKHSKTLEKSLGTQQCEEFIALHQTIQHQLDEIREQTNRFHNLRLSAAWYRCGHQLLEHYQNIKTEQGLLDFADLEWKTYQLLTGEQHAEWVQYKLDQRIDHLLVDEFQDTNPTQWQLLLPLLNEMAAGESDRRRSIFLVGDEKQSIYRFRRADPLLFDNARTWLTEHLQADSHKQHRSRRSSPAITDFVNIVFGQSDSASASGLENFPRHETHHENLWGRVELMPLIEADSTEPSITENDADNKIRNPLIHGRITPIDERYEQEAGQIVNRITELVGQTVSDNNRHRPLKYGDIMILVRDRTNIHYYEQALRRAAIPFVSSGKTGLLDRLEIRDIVQLMRILIAPYDNLALASVLRCPIFSCTDDDLIALAQSYPQSTHWLDRLQKQVSANNDSNERLQRAYEYLEKWKLQVDRIPVHDLLDQIYSDANVINRYISASPDSEKTQVAANLTHLLQLALDIDAGRYPGMSRFLAWLTLPANKDQQNLANPASVTNQRVQIMTIHGAKGLEAPIVFLADSARPSPTDKGRRALVDWPASEPRPRSFYFIGNKNQHDSVSQLILKQHRQAEDRENYNLLYVALTRAKQLLIISGCASKRATNTGWYHYISERVPASTTHFEHGQPQPMVAAADTKPTLTAVNIDERLSLPIDANHRSSLLSPSHIVDDAGKPDERANVKQTQSLSAAKTRGIAIHRMLELFSQNDDADSLAQLKNELLDTLGDTLFNDCLNEARSVLTAPQFKDFFDPTRYENAFNELPVLYQHQQTSVYGIIDRAIINQDEIVIVDYKTNSTATRGNCQRLAETYSPQLRLYEAGIGKLWPHKKVRSVIIFTHCTTAVDVPPAN